MNSEILILFLIALCLTATWCGKQRDYGVDFQRVEHIPGTTRSIFIAYAKMDRVGKGSEACAWGNMTYTEDFGNDIKVAVSTAVSTNGGSTFIPSPLKVPLRSFCDFVNTTWREYIAPTAKDVTTLPEIPPEGLCPFPKGVYDLKCFKIIPHDNWPNHIPPGVIKLTFKHTKNNEFIGGANMFINVFSLK